MEEISSLSKTPFEKVKSESRLTEKIAMLVPGYRGYKLKELRREADKLVRNYLYQQLTADRNDLKAILQKMVDNKLTDVWTDTDRLITDLDMVSSEINHASYGYAGFFDAVKVNEDRLDKVADFDSKLIDNVTSLTTKVKQFKGEILGGGFENTRTYMQGLRTMIDVLHDLYNDRTNILHGV
jgi:hypothetical protein